MRPSGTTGYVKQEYFSKKTPIGKQTEKPQ